MKFRRTKKLVFVNNKGGVGKTTLSYNVGVSLAKKGYKTALVDLDPQTNLSKMTLGEDFLETDLFGSYDGNISKVLRGITDGLSDVDLTVKLTPTPKIQNLYLLPGSLYLSLYEDNLISAFGEAARGVKRGYTLTSAVDRFLNHKGLEDEIDVFIIDTSPTLGLLNRIILLGSDYFVVPMMPDRFSVQGIENLGNVLKKWKDEWKVSAKALGGEIESQYLLSGEALFVGYIINSYNVYGKKPIKEHEAWIDKIPQKVKEHLSDKHSRNGLVEKSWSSPLSIIQDYGQLVPLSQKTGQAIFNLEYKDVKNFQQGTKENLEKSKIEFSSLVDNIIKVLSEY